MSYPMRPDDEAPARLRWARLRYSIIGQLLASPPEPGDLGRRIGEIAAKSWKHPTTGEAGGPNAFTKASGILPRCAR